VSQSREIWVFPEIRGHGEEVSKLSYGLLTEAGYIADKANASVTAVVLSDSDEGYREILGPYGISDACIFKHPLLRDFSAEIYASVLAERMQSTKPWLFLMGNTTAGKELAPRLAALLGTGVVTNCVKMDLSNPAKPKFYRPTLGEQAYQEIVFQTPGTMLVTMDPRVLNVTPVAESSDVEIALVEPKFDIEENRAKHLAYLSADFKTVDVAEAEVIVSAGVGAVGDDLLPLVEELAGLLEGSIGTTRPVVDEGKISRDRMIGQTGKVVSPELYLALGISGATHHIGGIQDSHTVVAVNRDPQAPIFQNADVGIVSDLKAVLPKLIERIKQAKV
jgi:electron transfer flavoprotein alpha subunit